MALLKSLIIFALGNFIGKGKATREFDLKDFPGPVLKTDHFFFSL